jgi:hypothetical protein
MNWQATDQFGNLYRGESESSDVESLRDEIADMLHQLRSRTDGAITITVDTEYGELNGPDPNQVSHILGVPWLEGADAAEVVSCTQELVAVLGLDNVTVTTT